MCEGSITRASTMGVALGPPRMGTSTSRTGRIEPEVAENGGRKAAKSQRPRPEHKHTAQTGRTNPIRLGSSSRKSPPRACAGRSPRARATKTAKRLRQPSYVAAGGVSYAHPRDAHPKEPAGIPPRRSGPAATRANPGLHGPRGHAPPPCATGLRPTSHPPTPN